MKENFFMVARKSTIRRLHNFIAENGFKTMCPKCQTELKQNIDFVECPNCNYQAPMLRRNRIVGLFVFQTGATSRTVEDYIRDLENAGKIEYVPEKDSYKAL